MFNRLLALECPKCCKSESVTQFTYGNVNANEYRIGDQLLWGRTQRGERASYVIVSGIAECLACHAAWFVDIHIADDTIVSATQHEDKRLYPDGPNEFIIVED